MLVNTPYDDVFRTLLNDCSSLIIPIVNEIFHESYSGDEAVEFYPNEHFVNGQDGRERERITDSCFGIRGRSLKKYHIECQSTSDDTMLVRMFEYDAQIALDAGEVYSGPHVKDQKEGKESLGQGSRNEALFIHVARGYPSR